MSETSIIYHLPMSVIRINGSRNIIHDRCLNTQPPPTTEASTALYVVADATVTCELLLHQGWFRQTQVDLALTDDGRLTHAGSESQGEAGTVVKAVLSTAATAFGVLAGAGWTDLLRQELVPDEVPVDQAQVIYGQTHAMEAGLIDSYGRTVVAMEALLASHLQSMSSSVPTKEQLAELRRVEIALADARSQLDRLEQHYKVWRAAQITITNERHSYDVSLDEAAEVRVTFDGRVTIPESARESRKAWEELGIVVECRSEGTGTHRAADPVAFRGVHVRQPHPVELKTWRRSDRDPNRAELVSVEHRLVVDSASPMTWIAFPASVWAKRKTSATFGATGALTSYEHAGDSVGAAIAKTLAEAPGDISDGLEQAVAGRASLAAAQSAQSAEALARTKRQVEQLQAQLSLEGLAATSESYAELERLKQREQLLETGNTIISLPTQAMSSEISALQHEVELLKLSQELAEPRSR